MFVEFFCAGRCCRWAGAWAGLFVFVAHGVFKAWLKLRLNQWYAAFYDLVQATGFVDESSGDLPSGEADVWLREHQYYATKGSEVTQLLYNFCWIVAPAIVVHPTARYIASCWTYTWRVTLIRAYLDLWTPVGTAIEGAAQRLHEDTLRFTDGVFTCIDIVLDSVLTLVIFSPLLYDLGSKIAPPLEPAPNAWLLWTAVGGAVGGLGVSALVGYRLVGLEVRNQAVEARLRTRLVMLAERPEDAPPAPYSLAFQPDLNGLWSNYSALFRNFVYMNTWLSFFDQVWVIAPYLLCAPRLFDPDPLRRITLGTLVQASNAFGKVFDSLAVVSNNWASVNAFRSVMRRIREYEARAYAARGGPRTGLVHSARVAHEMEMETATSESELVVESAPASSGETPNFRMPDDETYERRDQGRV